MNLQKKISEADLQRIKNAVKEAESKISGEIVPVLLERSGTYSIASYRAATALAAISFLLIVVFDRYVPTLAIYDPLFIFMVVLSAGFVGVLLSQWMDWIKRMVLTQQHLDNVTWQKAESLFLQEEVFNTRQRSGIMIFVSFFEHEVIVMADKGISKVVEQKVWDKLVQELTGSIKAGKVVNGLEVAIKRCGEILLEKGFLISADDTNELKDDLRIK